VQTTAKKTGSIVVAAAEETKVQRQDAGTEVVTTNVSTNTLEDTPAVHHRGAIEWSVLEQEQFRIIEEKTNNNGHLQRQTSASQHN
jgi:hypothetical protein